MDTDGTLDYYYTQYYGVRKNYKRTRATV